MIKHGGLDAHADHSIDPVLLVFSLADLKLMGTFRTKRPRNVLAFSR